MTRAVLNGIGCYSKRHKIIPAYSLQHLAYYNRRAQCNPSPRPRGVLTYAGVPVFFVSVKCFLCAVYRPMTASSTQVI